MGRAHARAPRVNEYLSVPKHGRPDLRMMEGGTAPAFAPAPERVERRTLRPDWLPSDLQLPEDLDEAIAKPRRRGQHDGPQRAEAASPPRARRTIVVTGQPQDPRFEPGSKKRRRRSPTAARLAGRPDRVAGWAVILGVAMAIMAGATAGSGPKAGDGPVPEPPAAVR